MFLSINRALYTLIYILLNLKKTKVSRVRAYVNYLLYMSQKIMKEFINTIHHLRYFRMVNMESD